MLALLGAILLVGLLLHGLDILPWERAVDDGAGPDDSGSLTAAPAASAAGLTGSAKAGAEAGGGDRPARVGDPVDFDAIDRLRDLHGVVVGPDGMPVAGARIRSFGRPWRRGSTLMHAHWDAQSPGLETVSARDGTFALRLRRGTEVSLRVEADGFATGTLEHRQPGERVRIVLQRPVVLEVVAKDPDGAPLADVAIELHGSDSARGAGFYGHGVTGADGRCRFEGLPAGGSVRIEAHHGALGGWADRWERFELPAEGTLRREVLINPGRIVRGVVTDARTQRPVADARVGMGWTLFKEVRTDAAGRYAIGGWTGQGYHELHVLAAGYARAQHTVGNADVIDVALVSGFALRGRVLGAGGRPLGGAQVAAVGSRTAERVQRISTGAVLTGPDGAFLVPDLRRDMPHTLVVMAEGMGRYVTRLEPPPEGARVREVGDVHLAAGLRVSGRVITVDGEPRPRMRVTVTGPQALGDDEASTYGREEERMTDDLGRFTFGDLAAGDYLLTAGEHGSERVARQVKLATEDLEGVSLRFEQRRELTVRVVDERRAPVSGVTVYARPRGAEDTYAFTGEDGTVALRLPMDVRWLDVHTFSNDDAYMQPETERLAADAGEHEIVLADAAIVAGRLLDPGGAPIRMAMLEARRGEEAVGSTTTDAQGGFRLAVSPGGPVDVYFRGDVWRDRTATGSRVRRRLALACVRWATPVPSEGAVLRAAGSPAEASLDVRVRLPDGESAEGFTVVIEPAADGTDGMATTDAHGRVRFEGLTAHPVGLSVRPPAARTSEFASWWRTNVEPDGQALDIRLPVPAILVGQVVDAFGAPVGGASVTCNRTVGGVMPTTMSDVNGRFRLALPPDDEHRFEIWASTKGPEGQLLHASVSGVDPREGPLRLELKPHRGW
jgi:protocatechuate 3,4-dioxygenase beta subunit